VRLKPITWRHTAQPFFEEENGATATEYAILLALLVLGSMGIIRSIGLKFENLYLAIAAKIPDV
jgi:Flp pilus assembly pilin Flp